ncbi:MAG: succinate dehydrogenase hydrophobic membrane anchor subunit [Microbacterium sp.]
MTTAADLAAPRSPQHPAPKKGVNLEKWGWLYMRISGVLLIVLIFGHLFVNLLNNDGGVHAIDFAFVAGKYATPFWQWWDVLMLWLAFIHGSNGMRTIVSDYITHKGLRTTLLWAIGIVAALMILLGTLVVFTFDPCAGVTGVWDNPDSSLYSICVGN